MSNATIERMPLPKGMLPDGDGWKAVRETDDIVTWQRTRDAIYVEQLIESGPDGGSFLGWYAKGHHDPAEFCQAVNYGYGLTSDSRRYCQEKHVRQIYYRTVKMPEMGGDYYEYRECEGPARGAWPVTVADIHWHDVQRQFEESAKTADHARREALNWVLFFMEQNEGRAPNVNEMREWASSRDQTGKSERRAA